MADLVTTLRTMTDSSARSASIARWVFLLVALGIVFVFLTTEIPLIADYKLYHEYRVQLIADRYRFVPHAFFGTLALLVGPLQFSSHFRQRHLNLHRILGRVYVISVLLAAPLAMSITWNRPLRLGTTTQATAWLICTAAAFLTARNRQITQHRQWMARSYAVTFTFVLLRLLDLWPRYWNLSEAATMPIIILVTFGSILAVDLGLNWHELTTERSRRVQDR